MAFITLAAAGADGNYIFGTDDPWCSRTDLVPRKVSAFDHPLHRRIAYAEFFRHVLNGQLAAGLSFSRRIIGDRVVLAEIADPGSRPAMAFRRLDPHAVHLGGYLLAEPQPF